MDLGAAMQIDAVATQGAGCCCTSCDAWVTAFVVMALGTMVGGATGMASNLMGDGGDVAAMASHWVMYGLMVGIGAMASVKIVEMT